MSSDILHRLVIHCFQFPENVAGRSLHHNFEARLERTFFSMIAAKFKENIFDQTVLYSSFSFNWLFLMVLFYQRYGVYGWIETSSQWHGSVVMWYIAYFSTDKALHFLAFLHGILQFCLICSFSNISLYLEAVLTDVVSL